MFASFILAKNIIRRDQELDVSDIQPRLLADFADRGCGEGFAVFEVAARAL